MTLRVNPEFATTLGAALASNLAWSNAFKTGLGATRRVICKVAPLGTAQEDVYNVGTKFRDAAITGTMVVEGGIVTNYGVTSNLTTSIPANLSAGVAILRIEGNGNWVEGTLGLTGSNCDFVLPSNPTATNSIAVLPNTRIKPPPFLWSGIGFQPPALDADAPAYIRFMNWQNPTDPVEIGRVYFNKRIENWCFTDADVSAAMGDVRVTQSTNTVVYGNATMGFFEFSAMLFSMNSAANGSEDKTLHQTLINCKPTSDTSGNWPRYPRYGGYKKATRTLGTVAPIVQREYGLSKTFPPAFKAEIWRAGGTTPIFTHEMRDGLPINSSELTDFPTTTKALRPKWNCAQLLFWQSAEPKMNPNKAKFFSGLDPRSIRHSMNKEKAAFYGAYCIYKPDQTLATEHWYAVDKWPTPVSATIAAATPSQDPYLYIQTSNGESAPWSTPQYAVDWMGLPAAEKGNMSTGISLIQGYGYEPGSYTMHNHYCGPGSVRIDRSSVAPGPIAIHMSNPSFVHLRSNTPIAEMVRHWNMGYFNHSVHYFTDAAGFTTLPLAEVQQSKWGYGKGFYNTNDSYVTGGVEYTVPQLAPANQFTVHPDEPHWGAYVDENNNMPWNGYCLDGLHDYTTPFYTAVMYSSPAHAYAWLHRYIAHLLVMGPAAPTSNMTSDIGIRSFAWMLLHDTHAWKIASDHQFGVRREEAFNRLVGFFNSAYRDYYVPLYVTNDQSIPMKVMRNLGQNVKYSAGKWYVNSFALHHYTGGVLAQMKQFGLWDLLWNHSTTVRLGMTMVLKMLDTGSIAYFLQTNAQYVGGIYGGDPALCLNNTDSSNAEVPANWGDWLTRVITNPADKTAISFARKGDGTPRTPDTSMFLPFQWVKIRKDYFGDIHCDYDLNAAATLCEGWQADRAEFINGLETSGEYKSEIRRLDWHYPPGYGFLNPPTPA